MLTYFPCGPNASGRYLVAYMTPGCNVATPILDCPNAAVAASEAEALNQRAQAKQSAFYAMQHRLVAGVLHAREA